MWGIKSPKDGYIKNILEISEGWAWAMMYQRQDKKARKNNCMPSKVPPDFIRGLKDIGYEAIRLKEIQDKKAE